ncbi:hypothetical protein [Streptomyces mirabilis]
MTELIQQQKQLLGPGPGQHGQPEGGIRARLLYNDDRILDGDAFRVQVK